MPHERDAIIIAIRMKYYRRVPLAGTTASTVKMAVVTRAAGLPVLRARISVLSVHACSRMGGRVGVSGEKICELAGAPLAR